MFLLKKLHAFLSFPPVYRRICSSHNVLQHISSFVAADQMIVIFGWGGVYPIYVVDTQNKNIIWFGNMLRVVSPSANRQAGGPPPVSCPWLYPPYVRPVAPVYNLMTHCKLCIICFAKLCIYIYIYKPITKNVGSMFIVGHTQPTLLLPFFLFLRWIISFISFYLQLHSCSTGLVSCCWCASVTPSPLGTERCPGLDCRWLSGLLLSNTPQNWLLVKTVGSGGS